MHAAAVDEVDARSGLVGDSHVHVAAVRSVLVCQRFSKS
jgi:hypothetical protein